MADVDLVRRDPRVQYVGLLVFGRAVDDAVETDKWAEYEERGRQENIEQGRIEKERIEKERIKKEANQHNELR